MEWIRWYVNIVEIVLNFSTDLKSSKIEFGWENYDQNTNHCTIELSSYGPYAPDPEIRTKMTADSCLIFSPI
jgi:hypothetical protein